MNGLLVVSTMASFALPILTVLLSTPVHALAPSKSELHLCDQVTEQAARETGVPTVVMQAVARTESGVTLSGTFVPWPWTINVEGKGVRFASKAQAVAYFQQQHALGARNIDVGCFQVNHRWHGANFDSISRMFDPLANARYAAKFLKELRVEMGDWTKAVGAYHSRNREFSEKYLARYNPILRDLSKGTRSARKQQVQEPRQNAFPLLTGNSSSAARGSLFPVQSSTRGSLLVPRGGNS